MKEAFFAIIVVIITSFITMSIGIVSAQSFFSEEIFHQQMYAGVPKTNTLKKQIPSKILSENEQASSTAKGNAERGKNIFALNCSSCHQKDGTGKTGLAPSIRNRDFLAIASDDFIRKTITKGRAETSMFARPDLSGEKVEDIIAYLRSVPTPVPIHISVDPNKKFEGDSKKGKELFRTYCSSCHGSKGEGYSVGVPGPAIGKKGFLDVASDDYIYQTLKQGRIGTAMKPFIGSKGVANLSNQEAYDIISYLRVINLSDSQESSPVKSSAKRDIRAGQEVFKSNCGACHKEDGTGKIGLAPSLRNRDFLAIASDDFIRETIKNGRPETAMFARPDLSEEKVNNIIAYLRSLKVKNPISIKVDPSKKIRGNGKSGEKLFNAHCSACHGEKGVGYSAGGSGPAIGKKGFLNTASDDYIYQTLKQGRIGTAMMSFLGAKGLSNLTDNDVADIIQYLRSLQ